MLKDRDKQILKLKAAIWESRNEERFLSKAIRSYKESEENQLPKETVKVVVRGKDVSVKEVPLILEQGELYENLHLTATLEEVIGDLYKETPEEVSFKELLG